jgi:DNA-binding NtrC family response regulator
MKKRILIVDDEASVVSRSKHLPVGDRVTVDIVETVEEAVILQGIRDYDFVLVRLQFTNSLGEKEFEVFRTIKENKTTTGIIVSTGCVGSNVAEEAFLVAASYYYEKRLSRKVFSDALRKLSLR